MRWVWAVFGAVILLAALPGCSSSRHTADLLRLPIASGTVISDPARATSPRQMFLASLFYSGLVRFGPDRHVVPDLAVSIPTVSANGSRYTFTVRRDARFADGRRCTALDVAYSLARALSPAVHSALARRYLGEILGARDVMNGRSATLSGVRILQPLTVQIRLARPDATFLQKLAFPIAFVVGSRVAGMHAVRPLEGHPEGTGPWVVDSRAADGTLTLRPRPHFYGDQMQLHRLILVPSRSSRETLDLYKRGSVDAAFVPEDEFSAWQNKPDFHTTNGLTAYYALPSDAAAAAFLTSLDREVLVKPFAGALSPLDTIVPPAVPDYVASAPSIPARRPRPAHIRLSDPRDTTLRDLGSSLSAELNTKTTGSPINLTLISVTRLLPDPGAWIRVAAARIHHPWYQRDLRSTSELAADPVSRMDTYSTLERWALHHGVLVPLASQNAGCLIRPNVSGLQVTAMGLMPDNGTWSTVQAG